MKKTGIVTDSHSAISKETAEELGIMVLPMPFYIEETCFLEGEDISWDELMNQLKEEKKITTSQPSPVAVMEIWDKALEQYEEILYLPISSGLSGSCSSAMAMAQEEKYQGKVFVVDNGRVATPLHQSILDAIELLEEGKSAAEVKERLEASRARMGIYIAVDDLKYLKNGGRISAATAVVGSLLKIKPVLYFDVGMLEMHQKCRGIQKAKTQMIEAVKQDFETKYPEELKKGEIRLLAASSADEEKTKAWVEMIQEAFPGMEVLCDRLSFGVSCHIGPGGFGIGYSCKP